MCTNTHAQCEIVAAAIHFSGRVPAFRAASACLLAVCELCVAALPASHPVLHHGRVSSCCRTSRSACCRCGRWASRCAWPRTSPCASTQSCATEPDWPNAAVCPCQLAASRLFPRHCRSGLAALCSAACRRIAAARLRCRHCGDRAAVMHRGSPAACCNRLVSCCTSFMFMIHFAWTYLFRSASFSDLSVCVISPLGWER